MPNNTNPHVANGTSTTSEIAAEAVIEVKSEINTRFEKVEAQNSSVESKVDKLSDAFKRFSEVGFEHKSGIKNDYQDLLTNLATKGYAEVTTENSFINNEGTFEKKSVMGTYNAPGLNISRNVQAVVDEGKPRTSRVLPRCRIISNGNSLKDLEVPFVNDDMVTVGFNPAGLSPQETQKYTFREAVIRLHQISAKYPNIDDRTYTMMGNGDLDYDLFQNMMYSLEKRTEITVGRAVMNGSGNNEPLGLLADYTKNGTATGYRELTVSGSALGKVENLISLIYRLDDYILEEGSRLTIFVHKDVLFALETAVTLAEDAPTRNDSKLSVDKLSLTATLRTTLGNQVDIIGLTSDYGLGTSSNKIAAVCGNFDYYVVGRSNASKLKTESIPGDAMYVMSRIGYFGGMPVRPKGFTFLKVS